MTDEQRAVVAWMTRVMEGRGWNAEQWAKRAGISGSTVSRAMHDDYQGTTSLPVIHALARAADVPSPVDFLAGYATMPTYEMLEEFLTGYCENRECEPRGIAQAVWRRFGGSIMGIR